VTVKENVNRFFEKITNFMLLRTFDLLILANFPYV